MAKAKVRSLVVRPLQSSDLSFEVAGVIDWQNPSLKLGARIENSGAHTTDALIAALRERLNTEHADVKFNYTAIQATLGTRALLRLRNSEEYLALEQAILQRNIQYLKTFRFSKEIGDVIKSGIAESVELTAKAKQANKERHGAIEAAYQADEDKAWRGVKKSTKTLQQTEKAVVNDLYVTPLGVVTPAYSIAATVSGPNSTQNLNESYNVPVYSGPDDKWVSLNASAVKDKKPAEPAFFAQRTVSRENDSPRNVVAEATEFWHPSLNNAIDYARSQGGVVQEEIKAKIAEVSTRHIDRVMASEMELIELEVLKTQFRLVNTYLFPMFSGVVTAVYKDVGEYIQPGEPVLRIENDKTVLLVGSVQYRGSLSVEKNRAARIQTNSPFEIDRKVEIPATLVSVRGHDSDDDEWEVVLEVDNSRQILPLNYHFDSKYTTIEFS